MYWFDSPEFAYAAVRLEVSHPPGQPLHALLGHLFARLPLVDAAFRVNLLSVAAAAACAALVTRAAVLLGASPLIAAAAGLLLNLCPTFVREGSRAEVYALMLAMMLV